MHASRLFRFAASVTTLLFTVTTAAVGAWHPVQNGVRHHFMSDTTLRDGQPLEDDTAAGLKDALTEGQKPV